MKSTTYIYGLCDPLTGHIRYVGKADDPASRLRQHLGMSKERRAIKRKAWISSLAAQGATPDLFILETIFDASWEEAEKFWIEYFKFLGADLLNVVPGGKGGRKPGFTLSDEVKEKISAAGKGRAQTREHREKIAAAHTGKKKSPEHAAKVAALKVWEKANAVWLGRKHSPETIAKMRKPKSAAHKAKLAAAVQRLWDDPDYRARQTPKVSANMLTYIQKKSSL